MTALNKDLELKCSHLYLLSKKSNLFVFPKASYTSPKFHSFSLQDYIYIRKFQPISLMISQLAKILAYIHQNLILPKKEAWGYLPKCGKVAWLYGDFGLQNIAINRDNSILLRPPTLNPINNHKVFLYDSIYFDIAYFKFSLLFHHPLSRPLWVSFSTLKRFYDIFERNYGKIDEEILGLYFDKICEKYIQLTPNKFINKIKKRIIIYKTKRMKEGKK